MKKVLAAVAVTLAVLLVAAGVLAISYHNVNEAGIPQPSMNIMGHTLPPSAYIWYQPVLGGLLHKPFTESALNEAAHLGQLEQGITAGGLAWPEGYEATLEMSRDGTLVYSGEAAGFQPRITEAPGTYALVAHCVWPQQDNGPYGSFIFRAGFAVPQPPPEPEPEPEIPDEPVLEAGNTQLQQGDIFAMRILYLPGDITPTASTELGFSIFTQRPSQTPGGTEWFCAVPVGNTRAPGSYEVRVTAGDYSWDVQVTVESFAFEEQNLIIDVSDPVISEANSPAAYQQYREKIPPLFQTYDEACYWEGPFIQPVQGRISTHFGTIRYTNSNFSSPGYHWGMDIANAEGTPIVAPGAGRVVLAEYLLNTGNTIVIEHGGGLKSYYFHMVELHVEPEDMVEQGQLIGAVGTTGYSTGPHLHFEMRIGNQAVSPELLFEETAGLYSVGAPQEKA